MKRLRRIILSTMLFMLMVIASSSSVFATTELAYDDGTAENGLSADAGTEHAVRFSLQPGWSSAKILTARYFIWDLPATFRLHIYGGGVTDPALDVTPIGVGWFDVDLSSYNIVVSGDFYISIEYLASSPFQPPIGMDTTSPSYLRSYARDPGETSWELGPGTDTMIRAVVDPNVPVGGVLVPKNILEILTPYIALAGLIAAISIVYFIKKRK